MSLDSRYREEKGKTWLTYLPLPYEVAMLMDKETWVFCRIALEVCFRMRHAFFFDKLHAIYLEDST
jgi:hypothetical protein